MPFLERTRMSKDNLELQSNQACIQPSQPDPRLQDPSAKDKEPSRKGLWNRFLKPTWPRDLWAPAA